jgi:ATP-dependent Clp endopeptidase proteolytic subunit ClpP
MLDVQEEQSVDLMSYLVRQRIVYIGDRVVESSAMQTTVQLLALEAVDPETEIQIYINSTGGYPAAANAIVDTMKCLKCPVSTIALGACLASSMLVLAAGTKGRRFAMPNARLMLHQPTGGAEGTIFDVTPQAQELNRSMRVLQAMLADFSSMTLEQVEMETDRRTYFGPKEAVEKGLIDGIIEWQKRFQNLHDLALQLPRHVDRAALNELCTPFFMFRKWPDFLLLLVDQRLPLAWSFSSSCHPALKYPELSCDQDFGQQQNSLQALHKLLSVVRIVGGLGLGRVQFTMHLVCVSMGGKGTINALLCQVWSPDGQVFKWRRKYKSATPIPRDTYGYQPQRPSCWAKHMEQAQNLVISHYHMKQEQDGTQNADLYSSARVSNFGCEWE